MYSIGQVSAMFDISISTLRFYANEGLFPRLVKRGKWRYFTEDDLQLVNTVKHLRQTGMPLAEISQYIAMFYEGDKTVNDRLAVIERHHEKVLEDMEGLKRCIQLLERKIKYYKALKTGENACKYIPDLSALIKKAELAS